MILIGPMGSGKSTIGRQLAARLRVPFVDVDAFIEERANKPILQIFEEDGECVFRAMEGEAIAEICNSGSQQVIATGGGAVTRAPNCQRMQEHGRVIWLDASPETLASRIAGKSKRPLLNGMDPLLKSRELCRQRQPMYEQCAELRLNRDHLDVEKTVDAIMLFLSESDNDKHKS